MKLKNVNKWIGGRKAARILLAQLGCALFFLFLMGTEAFALFQPDLMLRPASEGDASYIGAGIFESSAVVQTASQAAFPGAPAQFRLLLKNSGDQEDRFLLTGPGSGSGYAVGYLDEGGMDRGGAIAGGGYLTPLLQPGESIALLVRVTPTLFTPGASYAVAVTAVSISDATRADQVRSDTVACSLTAAVTLSAPPDGSGTPASEVNYSYTVTNVGSAVNSFTLSVASGAGWQAALYADDGAGGGIAGNGVREGGEKNGAVSTGPLPPGASYRFFVAVSVPGGGGDGARSDALVAATGEGARGSDQVTTTVVAPVLTLAESVRNLTQGGAFAAGVNALPGDVLQYRMSVTNSGSAPATSVSIDSPLPSGLTLAPDGVTVALQPEGEKTPCAAAQCGWARFSAGSIVARLGEGATEISGGTLLPGRTVYLFFRAQVN